MTVVEVVRIPNTTDVRGAFGARCRRAASWSASAAAAATNGPRPTRERVEPMAVDCLLNNHPLIGRGLTPAVTRPMRRAPVRAVGRTSTHSIFQQKEQLPCP
jgi:hypothetical protein